MKIDMSYHYMISGGRIHSECSIEYADPVNFEGPADIEICYLDNKHKKRLVSKFDKGNTLKNDLYQVVRIEEEFLIYRNGICIIYGQLQKKLIFCDFYSFYYNALLIVINRIMLDRYIYIHAGAIQKGDTAFGLMADAGTGKSLTTWGLAKKEGKYITDDILPLQRKRNTFYAAPSSSVRPRFTLNSLHFAGIDPLTLPKDIDRSVTVQEDKYYIRTHNLKKCTHHIPLKTIFILRPDDHVENVKIKSLDIVDLQDQVLYNNLVNKQFNIITAPNWRIKDIISDLYYISKLVRFKEIKYQKRLENFPAIVDAIWAEA